MGKTGPKPRPPEDRFWPKVDASGDCWQWTAAVKDTGYGNFWVGYDEGWARPHRFAWELLVGPIPDGLDLDHLCRNRLCCNPDHLEPVTRRVNLLRGNTITARWAKRTHCEHGHPLDGVTGKGRRYCKECGRQSARARGKRKRAEANARR